MVKNTYYQRHKAQYKEYNKRSYITHNLRPDIIKAKDLKKEQQLQLKALKKQLKKEEYNRPGCLYPDLSFYSAHDKGCRCSSCCALWKEKRFLYFKNYSESILNRANDALRTRAKNRKETLNLDPVEKHLLLLVYIKSAIITQLRTKTHVDHIIPLNSEGSYSYKNTQILSKHDNLKKSSNGEHVATPLDLESHEEKALYEATIAKFSKKRKKIHCLALQI